MVLASSGRWLTVVLVLLGGGAGSDLVWADDAPTNSVGVHGPTQGIGLPLLRDAATNDPLMPPLELARGIGIASLSTPKAFPAVPKSLFLSLFGFFCVSLVRDRRVWLAAAVTIGTCGLYCFEAGSGRVLRVPDHRQAYDAFPVALSRPLDSVCIGISRRLTHIADRVDRARSISAYEGLSRGFDLLFPYSFSPAGHTHVPQPQLTQRLAARSPPLGAHPSSVAEALGIPKGRCAQGLWAC